MIGIVVVSHSRRLAEGVVELASLMTGGRVPILAAAGVSEDVEALGTDAVLISETFNALPGDADILVFMDQGSALLSSETALELVEPEVAARVTLCSAPIVEGVVAAAAAASGGLSKDQALAEARDALSAKRDQLGEAPDATVAPATAPAASEVPVLEWTVPNPHGLHARPCARIVGALAGLSGTFTLARGEATANALSINQLARLGARKGHVVRFLAAGPDAAAARERFAALCALNFGDSLDETTAVKTPELEPVATGRPGVLVGIPVSAGVFSGPVRRPEASIPVVPDRSRESGEAETARLREGLRRAERSLETVIEDTRKRLGGNHADIFEAHLALVRDPDLLERAGARIAAGHIAEAAWAAEMDDLADAYRHMEDEYARAREADALDVKRRVLVEMGCSVEGGLDFDRPVILVADDLNPSDTAGLDPALVLGLCMTGGGRTSHSAILARALGIPAIARVKGAEALRDGAIAVLDGERGEVIVAPSSEEIAAAETARATRAAERERGLAAAKAPARTLDGFEPEILANIAGEADVARALAGGADGVGLLRTEFLFMGRDALPDEEEQAGVYTRIAEALKGRPLIIRTLDIGGDKPLAALRQEAEENPFLGLRGIRLCLARPQVFDTQLRAISRAAARHPGVIRVMFPMISTVDEFRAAKARFEDQRRLLAIDGIAVGEVSVGIMIEVPAAVFSADDLARDVDFFSIGTNDLTQYVMAADRGNGAVAGLVDPNQPAVLRAISATCRAAAAAGIPVGMCGEFAGDPRATELLLGLGLTEFSMSAGLIADVKAAVARVDMKRAREIAETVLAGASA